MSHIEMINKALEGYMPESEDIVSRAMLYSVENGGKRIRPELVLSFCEACGGDAENALPLACALEMIHTYSLIHDDLPCMDNDDFRRGKPSCHIAFGYEYALLAGDALLTLAFETAVKAKLPADRIIDSIAVLSKAAGWAGMVGGQVMDLKNEGKKVSIEDIEKTDALKTGELIRAACVMGCIAAGRKDMIPAAEEYARCIGISFQIVDDILDVTSDEATLGKPVGSDAENCKNTYVSLLGLEEAKKIAAELTRKAIDALGVFGDESEFLVSLSKKLLSRNK